MNHSKNLLAAGLLLSLNAVTAQATLIDRGNGMIYDSTQNITWLQDANYAQTSGFDGDGQMNWSAATAWATGLVYQGYSDWRLPTITDTGVPGCDSSFSGTDCGYNVDTSTSEMAHLFFTDLGNLSSYDTAGNLRGGSSGVDWGVVNSSFFIHLQNSAYWSGNENTCCAAFAFDPGIGAQGSGPRDLELYAWAVRSGDVAANSVPEPGSLALLGLGLIVLRRVRRR